jgi:hypothetical protein
MRFSGAARTFTTISLLKLLCTILAICALVVTLPVQAAAVSEADFWRMLQRTASILEDADESQRASVVAELRSLWQGVDEVRLEDAQTLTVDMQWLTQSDTTLEQLEDYTRALLDFHARGGSLSSINTTNVLNILNGVLQDARFQYPTPTPFPAFEPRRDAVSVPMLTPEISQAILIAFGVAAVFAVLIYFARGLRVLPTTIENPEAGEDPTTSTQAQELAKLSEDSQDYRAAIRYLYLASLLLLDERGVLRYDPTLTNRELLRQINNKSAIYELLRSVVQTFDRVWYGFAPVSESLYQDFRQNVEQLRMSSK